MKETPVVHDKWEPITAISDFPVLRELSLISVGPITEFHLGRLHRLKSLEALSLDSTDVTSDGFVKLAAALPNLKRIRLPQSVLNPSLVEELQRRGIDVAH